jgi:hypothetical protein
MLTSRAGLTPESFVKQFIDTLQPGVIPRSRFIDWRSIQTAESSAAKELEYYQTASECAATKGLGPELRDALLAEDSPHGLLQTAFALLGHTGDVYVSQTDAITISALADRISQGDASAAELAATVLVDLGIGRVLARSSVSDAFFGVRIGLECNRRKNVGGDEFKKAAKAELEHTIGLLSTDFKGLSLSEEVKIRYGGVSKKVDFAILKDASPVVGLEVNFYTTTGSKPTEIKRSYESVTRGLHSVGIELVWVTDGYGYNGMKRSLADAFRVLPNIYNLSMLRTSLKDDLATHLFSILHPAKK